jgi:hypothetical protein
MAIKTVAAATLAVWILSSAAFGQIVPGGAPAYQQAGKLPARILSFTAEPAAIQPGQSVLLRWDAENGQGPNIDQGIGPVTPRGSLRLTPKATTTYTFTVNGTNGALTKDVTVTVAGTTPVSASAQAETAKKEILHTPDGKPDLSGVYNFSFGGGGRGRGAAAPAPGGIATTPTLKPGAEKFKVVRPPDDAGLTSDCMPLGVPGSFNVPYPFQIIQARTMLTIFYEYPNTFRIIPIDGRPHPVDPDPTWMGNSVGHWEGDTLVVDSIGFNEKTEVSGYHHTEALHVVERFRRQEFATLHYEVTIEDPNVFVGPWTETRNYALRPELEKIDEFVCENNRDYKPLFKKQ